MRGVLLLAIGNPYYGNYAVQLARSIKAVDPDMKVSCAYAGQVLSHNRSLPFDDQIAVPMDHYLTDGLPDYIKAKTFLYDLSPYEETIFIDADVIWLPQKPISQLFDQFGDTDIIFSNHGKEKVSEAGRGFIHWADPKEIMRVYGEGTLYNLASEFIYFRKGPKAQTIFEIAQQVYRDPQIEFRKFGFGLPDELAFEIALLKTGTELKQAPFIPFYWEQYERRSLPIYEIYKQYYGYSLGGNVNTGQVANIYNNLATHYNSKFGIRGCFPAKDKRSWLSERQTL